ncbi:MAG TPA: MlaD family protein [Rhizomicrobium sp.]|nr:MlaD family protein [Rhizomicrobium sp.]
MMPQGLRPAGNLFETIVSALVILVALAFLVFVYKQTGTGHFGSYSLTLRMPSAAGLDVGKDVRVGGVKVGSISHLSLDRKDFSAIVQFDMRDDLLLPADSTAAITSTPLGDVYLVINPGHAVRKVSPGGVLMQPGARRLAPAAGT